MNPITTGKLNHIESMEIVFATHNQNKLKELQAILPAHIELVSLQDIGCQEDIPETAPTIEGNALQKARYIKKHYGKDCFADDTGLEVEALEGAPGVYSARYAGEAKNDTDNIAKLLRELEDESNRKAQFRTVIALVQGEREHVFTGICPGEITRKPSGTEGFGYDPVFLPQGQDKTFAQMSLAAKSAVSHRAKAVQKLVQFLSK